MHLLVLVLPSMSLSKLIQYIKGKSSRKLLYTFNHLHKRYRRQHLWSKKHFAVTLGNVNAVDAQKHIEEQEIRH